MALIVLDGWGLSQRVEGNAIALARTPNMDRLHAFYPSTTLEAHGEAVGLSEGQMGNSNVGHLNLGAGRIVYQDLVRIDRAIRDGSFFSNPVLLEAMRHASTRGRPLHLLGLLSDGGVHSHIRHLFALLEMACRQGLKVLVHCFLDGRDVPPANAAEYLQALEGKLAETGAGDIATVMGRYYAMDRDRRWDRTRKAYEAMVVGEGRLAPNPLEGLHRAYEQGETDEFVVPTVITGNEGKPRGKVEAGDSLIFYNFRADRARQITRAFTEEDFLEFSRPTGYLAPHFVGMTRYDETFTVPFAFPPRHLANTLGEVVSRAGMRQLRIAETEKYAHVTYFFSGGEEEPFAGEDRRLIPSPRVATYDQKPEMSAPEVTRAVLEEIAAGRHDVIILNYANPDMVGHTGVLEAAIRAIEVVDTCVGEVVKALLARGGAAIVLSDHGNAEQMLDYETGEPHTAHTSNPVPCILVDDRRREARLRPGILADVAPTLLELIGLPRPGEMDHDSLILKGGT